MAAATAYQIPGGQSVSVSTSGQDAQIPGGQYVNFQPSAAPVNFYIDPLLFSAPL